MASGPGLRRADDKPLEVVPHLDLEKYLGTWYEIASIPYGPQKNCVAVTATYSSRKDGGIEVVNRCRVGTLDGRHRSIRGKAWVVDPATNAKLKVSFFWPFSGDYWVIELDPEYRYAVVGHPSRDYLWVLSRSPRMEEAMYRKLLRKVERKGYDVNRLVKTPQPVAVG